MLRGNRYFVSEQTKEVEMKIKNQMFFCASILAMSVLISRCNSPPPSPPAVLPSHVEDGHGHAHAHSHADEGPNGGHLIELGNEEYHGEWLHDDDSGKLT